MDGVEVPPLFLLRPAPPLPGPAAALMASLQPGPRTLQEVRGLGLPLAEALAALQGHPLGAGLHAQGQTLRWAGESDLRDFWAALAGGDLAAAWALYGPLLPGYGGAWPRFAAWLEAERGRMLAGLLDAALPDPARAHALAEAELSSPADQTRALAACLLQAEAFLRGGRPKEAVLILGKALGLQEFAGQGFSALSLALLAEAHALWNRPRKAQETARKALARAAHPYPQSRAHLALYRALHDPDDLRAARHEALQAGFANWSRFLGDEM